MIEENFKVKTLVEKNGFPENTVGVVVSIYSSGPACEVELWDDNQNPIDVVTYPLTEIEQAE